MKKLIYKIKKVIGLNLSNLMAEKNKDVMIGEYGRKIIRNMYENHRLRYIYLVIKNKLLKLVAKREMQIVNMQLNILENLEAIYPTSAINNETMDTVQRMNTLMLISKFFAKKQILKPI